nr:hypothetical protein [Tanacetum cinerariifolium]
MDIRNIAFGHCRDALSVMIYILDYHSLEAPPSLDYVPSPEYPPSLEFVPELVYPEFMPAEDDILPTEEQQLPAAASPATESDPNKDPEDDPEEDHKDGPEEDPVDYPVDGGDEGDDEDESFDDDDNDDDIDIEWDEKEDKYLAPDDSTAVALLAIDHASSTKDTEPFETDESAATPSPHPTYRVTARISIRPQTPISLPSDTEIARLMAILLHHHHQLQGRAKREEILEVDLPLQKRLCIAHTGTYELGESSAVAATRLREPVRDDLYRLFKDRRFHAHTARLMEGEARASRMAWTQLMDASDATYSGVIALRTQEENRDLRATHCKLQAQFIWALTALKSCQTQLATALERIHILEAARVPAQPEFSTCTLLGSALTWWNSYVMTVGPDAAYAMTWVDMKKKMTDKYCPTGEMKKLESQLWNLRVKGNDVAIEMANELIDKRNNTWAERQAENKRKVVDTSRSNQSQQQQQNKRQNIGMAYTAGFGEKKPYRGSKPLFPKCNYHHNGPCAPKFHQCNKVGHFARDCRSTTNVNTANNQRGNLMGQKPTCYECGSQGYFRKDFPKFKNNNRGTQGGNATTPAKVYAVGHAGTNPDSNVVTCTFLLNNRYAFILFDTGLDRSFESTAFYNTPSFRVIDVVNKFAMYLLYFTRLL